MAYLDLTPLTDLCNQHEGRAHCANDRSSPEETISDPAVPGAEATEAVSGVFCGTRKLRTDTKGTGHAGQGHQSQHARGGTEADSDSPGHPTVIASSFPKAGTSENG